jgi:hypothetical protein
MLICGQVNPPPLGADYNGFYFSESDDVAGKARNLRGTPLRVEHNDKTHVGQVLQGWTDSTTGAMWALAEINTKDLGGALTAAAVERGLYGEFSLGYKTRFGKKNESDSSGSRHEKIVVLDKEIMELSIVKKGARDGCTIHANERPVNFHRTKSIIHK